MQETQKQVLGPYVAVSKVPSLSKSTLQYLLATSRVRKVHSVSATHRLPWAQRTADLLAQGVTLDSGLPKDIRRAACILIKDAQEEMLGADIRMPKLSGVLPGPLKCLPYRLSEVVARHGMIPRRRLTVSA
jgi:hypothetical protein